MERWNFKFIIDIFGSSDISNGGVAFGKKLEVPEGTEI